MRMKLDLDDAGAIVFAACTAVLLLAVAMFFSALVMQYGWNQSVPDIFSLPRLSFRNAMGLTILCFSARIFSTNWSAKR